LDEFGVADFPTLLRRIAFWVRFYISVGAALIGIMLVGNFFGALAMSAVVFILFVLALNMEGRAPAYMREDWPDQPRLPPSGKQALPPRGARQVARSNQALIEASTGVAEKETLKRQETLSKNWRVTPAMIACDAARGTALGHLLRKQDCRHGAGRAHDRGAPSMGTAAYPSIPSVAVAYR
jgi:hypothetical protein